MNEQLPVLNADVEEMLSKTVRRHWEETTNGFDTRFSEFAAQVRAELTSVLTKLERVEREQVRQDHVQITQAGVMEALRRSFEEFFESYDIFKQDILHVFGSAGMAEERHTRRKSDRR